jgi:hypothetical protein
MKIVHCDGHDFWMPTVDQRLAGKMYTCKKCKLKVSTPEAVSYLTGKKC